MIQIVYSREILVAKVGPKEIPGPDQRTRGAFQSDCKFKYWPSH